MWERIYRLTVIALAVVGIGFGVAIIVRVLG